jgi:hypothetical protein
MRTPKINGITNALDVWKGDMLYKMDDALNKLTCGHIFKRNCSLYMLLALKYK